MLTVAQIAATLVLLAAAGLLGNGFLRLSRQDAGFDPSHLVNLEFGMPEWRYPSPAERQQLLDRMRDLAASLPNVVDATVTASIPPNMLFEIQRVARNRHAAPSTASTWSPSAAVDPGFFHTLGIPIVEGRPFDARDDADGSSCCDREPRAGRPASGREPALGHRFREPPTEPWMTVVGVAGNAETADVEQPLGEAAFYTPRAQSAPSWFESLVARTGPAPEQVVPAVRAIVSADDA